MKEEKIDEIVRLLNELDFIKVPLHVRLISPMESSSKLAFGPNFYNKRVDGHGDKTVFPNKPICRMYPGHLSLNE